MVADMQKIENLVNKSYESFYLHGLLDAWRESRLLSAFECSVTAHIISVGPNRNARSIFRPSTLYISTTSS
jgi:hypothetical protein